MQEQQRKIDEYTRKTRRKREGNTPLPDFLHRLRNGVEAVNRRFWYGLLKQVLRNQPVDRKLPVSELQSILIIPYGDAIGDLLVSTAAARVIKRRNPNCKIGIVTSARNESLLRCDTDFDAQYPFTGRSDRGNYRNLSKARAAKYQVVLNLHFQRMSDYGLISNYISPKGLKVSVQHKRGELYRILFNHLSDAARFQVQISQLGLKLLDDVVDLGSEPIKSWESRPIVHICPDIFERTKTEIDRRLGLIGAKWFIYLNPQARHPNREWGAENTMEFCDRILAKYPETAIILTASPVAQGEWKARLIAHGEQRVQFFDTGYDLNELASVCRLARLIMTPDTAVVHLASAERKPIVVFYTNPQIPREWLPLQVPAFLFSPKKDGEPVSSVPVEEVIEGVSRLLNGTWKHTATTVGLEPTSIPSYQSDQSEMDLIELIDPQLSHRNF